MRNEYLFLSDENRATVEVYRPKGIIVEIYNIESTPLWVATYSLDSKSEESAKILSDVHKVLMQYSPLVLSCESSEYFNRMLFPLANEMERKLRKMLYLVASISDDQKAKESIKQLEEKDFGEIFDLLFIDQEFISNMKKRIIADGKSEFNGRSRFSKKEIKTYLESLVEHTLWDTILGENDVPTLRQRFRDVQTYRNDIMHAHNISKEVFGKAKYLFEKINQELVSTIDGLLGKSGSKSAEQKPEANMAIASALAAIDITVFSEALRSETAFPGITELSSQLSRILKELQPLNANAAMADALKGVTMQPAVTEALKVINQMPVNSALAEVLKGSQSTAIKAGVSEALKALQPIQNNNALVEALHTANAFQTSPAVASLLQQLSQINDLMKPYRQMEQIFQSGQALQDSLRSITNGLPPPVTGVINDKDGNELKDDIGKKEEEDNPNE